MPANPLPQPSAPPVAETARILLLNPQQNGSPVRYVLEDLPFTMQAGMVQEIELGTTVIRFDRGGDFGEARYTLQPGTFQFVLTQNGWDLVRTTFVATLDNAANATPFHLLLDGQPLTIPAGSQQTVTSDYPLDVVFDAGTGGDPARRRLADGQTYTIGINDAGQWDLLTPQSLAGTTGQPPAPGIDSPTAISPPAGG